MKKKIILTMLLMFAVALVACGKKEDTDANKGNVGKGTTIEAKKELIVGTEAGFAPYEYLEGNDVVGIDMDIAQAIADSLGRKLVIKNMEFTGALLAVQQGKVDLVIAGVSVDKDRKKVMDFSEDYVNTTEVVVVNKENSKVKSVDDLNNKVIGVQQGNIADFYVSNKDNVKAKEVKRYTKFAQASEDLKNGKIDCIVMDQYPAEELVANNDSLILLDGTLFEDKYAVALKKGNTELLDQVNAVIKQLKEDGKIEEFTKKHTSK